jgi:hypothetical protein
MREMAITESVDKKRGSSLHTFIIESPENIMENTENRDFRVTAMLAPSEVEEIDNWRRHQPDLPSRSETVRRFALEGLRAEVARKARRAKRQEGTDRG